MINILFERREHTSVQLNQRCAGQAATGFIQSF